MKKDLTIGFFCRLFCFLAWISISSEANAKIATIGFQTISKPTVTDSILEDLQNKIRIWSTDSSVTQRRVANHRFVQNLGRLIRSDHSREFPWSELYPVSVLNSPDGRWKILTWSVLLEQNARRHYGCLFDSEGRLYPLLDQQANRFEVDTVYDGQQWPGAVYFEILPIIASHDGLPCYAVIGYDAREPFSQRKVVDWICPDTTQNQVLVGAPLIRMGPKTQTRLQLVYPLDVRVQMNWDNDQGLIYFDHLINRGLDPSSAAFDFIPDGSFDGLVWENGSLVFKEIPNYQPSR